MMHKAESFLSWFVSKKFLFVLIIFLASRLPFLHPGFGTDPDAWRMVLSSKQIFETGQYSPSRLPGFPVPEFTYSLLLNLTGGKPSPILFNLITALFSLAAVYFFYLILVKLNIKNVYPLLLCFIFTPIFFINSVNSMDYNWAMAFILASFYFCLSDKQLISGIMLGLAAGSRISSLVFLIPFNFWIIYSDRLKANPKRSFSFTLSVLLITAMVYFPVYSAYGLHLFSYDKLIYPAFLIVFGRMTIKVWGVIGTVSISAVVLFILFIKKRLQNEIESSYHKIITLIILIIIAIYFLLFLRLPLEAGYLIPAIPFFFILIAKYLTRNISIFLAASLTISSFILNIDRTGFELVGPIWKDHLTRMTEIQSANLAIDKAKKLNTGNYRIISEGYLPKIKVEGLIKNTESKVIDKFIYLPAPSEIDSMRDSGITIYYLKNAREGLSLFYNDSLFAKMKSF
jgi:hypothetical protein